MSVGEKQAVVLKVMAAVKNHLQELGSLHICDHVQVNNPYFFVELSTRIWH